MEECSRNIGRRIAVTLDNWFWVWKRRVWGYRRNCYIWYWYTWRKVYIYIYLNPLLMINMLWNTWMDKLSNKLTKMLTSIFGCTTFLSLPSWSTFILLQLWHNPAPCEACFAILGCTARIHRVCLDRHGESRMGVQTEKIQERIEPVHCHIFPETCGEVKGSRNVK